MIFPTHSAEWPRQRQAIEDRIAHHHRELEVCGRDDVQLIQGQILTLRWLIEQADPEVRLGAGSAYYGV